MTEQPWRRGGKLKASESGKPRFSRPEYDATPIDYVKASDGTKTPVFRHCQRCGAYWIRGRWETQAREDGSRRPKYDGGGFFYLGAKGSRVFSCDCQAARQNYPNVPEVPDWYLQLWEDQGRPLVAKSIERLEIEEAMRKAEEETDGRDASENHSEPAATVERGSDANRGATPESSVAEDRDRGDGKGGGGVPDDLPPLPF